MTYLPRDGREYFHWTFTGLPDGAVGEVFLNGAWRSLEMDGNKGSILLAGPDANPFGAIVLTDDVAVQVRVSDGLEDIVRGGGWIRLSGEPSPTGPDLFRHTPADDTPVITFEAYDVWSDTTTIPGSLGRYREKRVGAAEVTPPANQASTADLDLTGSTHYRYHGFPRATDFAANSSRSVSTPLKPGGSSQFANWLFGVEFVTSSPVVKIALNPVGTNVNLGFITVNGLRISDRATPFTATGGNPTEAVFTFPHEGRRTIRIEGLNQNQGRFGGVTVAPGYTITRPTFPVRRRVAFIGDSFVNGNGIGADQASETETFVWRLGTYMGADEIIQAGVGGTGFVNGGGDGATGVYQARIADVLAMQPDLLVFSGGYNDTTPGLSDAIAVALAATTGVRERYVVYTGVDATVRDVYRTAAATAGVKFAAPDVVGLVKLGDGVHPTYASHQILADETWQIIKNA